MKLLKLNRIRIVARATPLRSNGPFDGSSVARSIPMPHDKTWLEVNGKRKESSADEWCDLIDAYIQGRMDYKTWYNRSYEVGRIK